jgi:hypothetical protein
MFSADSVADGLEYIAPKTNSCSWHRQILLPDNFPAPVGAEGFQTELPVFLHSTLHSLLLFFPEVGFCHSNDVICVEIKSSHVNLVDEWSHWVCQKMC